MKSFVGLAGMFMSTVWERTTLKGVLPACPGVQGHEEALGSVPAFDSDVSAPLG